MPMISRGAIAAVESAAIAHQLMPCDPVWLATMTGNVVDLVPVSSAAKKYSFQHRMRDRMKAATMPGSEIGSTILRNAPHTLRPSTSAASSSSRGIALN
jgi:hypothetical protein